jgi:hypothetical protein
MNTKQDPRAAEIQQQIDIIRGLAEKPITFAKAWGPLRQSRPDLFDDDKPAPTSAATQEMSQRLAKRDALSMAAAAERAQAREATIHDSRPKEDGSVTVECLSAWSIRS